MNLLRRERRIHHGHRDMTRVWRGLGARVATAHEHAHRAHPAVPARRRRSARIVAAAASAQPGQDRWHTSTAHGAWGRFLDRIGMFDVFGSVWFAAIYLLLFVSLLGCLVPRIRDARSARSTRKPLPAPRNLDRLPESGSFETAGDADGLRERRTRGTLGRRWRIAISATNRPARSPCRPRRVTAARPAT